MAPPKYAIASVENALRLILLLRERQNVRLIDAATAIGVAPSTAHRLLAMLCHHGFAVQEDDRTYSQGPAIAGDHRPVAQRPGLRLIARRHLEWLGQQTNETIHLMVLTGASVTFLDSIEAQQSLRVGPRIGAVMPAHLTSGGEAILASLDFAVVEALLAGSSDGTGPGDMEAFRAHLVEVRRRGYGTNFGRSERGLAAVGACVRDGSGEPVAAVSLSAPTLRLTTARIAPVAALVVETARRISASLVAKD